MNFLYYLATPDGLKFATTIIGDSKKIPQKDRDRTSKILVSITTYECDENDQLIAVKVFACDILFNYEIHSNF